MPKKEEGHLKDDIINNTQQKLCDDVRELEMLAKPILAEMLRNSNIAQVVTMDAPQMQRAAAKKFQQMIILINSDNKKQQQLKKKASDPDQHQNA